MSLNIWDLRNCSRKKPQEIHVLCLIRSCRLITSLPAFSCLLTFLIDEITHYLVAVTLWNSKVVEQCLPYCFDVSFVCQNFQVSFLFLIKKVTILKILFWNWYIIRLSLHWKKMYSAQVIRQSVHFKLLFLIMILFSISNFGFIYYLLLDYQQDLKFLEELALAGNSNHLLSLSFIR